MAAAEWANPGPPGPGVGSADVHDGPVPPGRDQSAGQVAAAQVGAVEHDVDDRSPGIGAHVLGRNGEVARRVVDQYVDRTEGELDGVEGAGDGLGLPDVTRGGEGGAPGLLDGRGTGQAVVLVPAQDGHGRAQPAELGGDGLAESRTAPGHDHHRAVVGSGGRAELPVGGGWRSPGGVMGRSLLTPRQVGGAVHGRTASVAWGVRADGHRYQAGARRPLG